MAFISTFDHVVVEFTCAVGAYHRCCCQFKSRSGRIPQHYVMEFVGYLRQVGGNFENVWYFIFLQFINRIT
jgi:hypothetical protein